MVHELFAFEKKKCNEFLNLACRLIIISILHRVMDNNIFNIFIDQRPPPRGNGHPPNSHPFGLSIEEAKTYEGLRQFANHRSTPTPTATEVGS